MSPEVAMIAVWVVWALSWWGAASWANKTVGQPDSGSQFLYRAVTVGGAVLLFGPREIIAIKQTDDFAAAAHVPDPYIGMIDRNVAAFLERKSEQFFRREKGGLDHVFQAKIGFQFRFIEII